MTKTPQRDVIAGQQAVDLGQPHLHEPVSNETATILRAICQKVDEPFDGGLTEQQSLDRIAALREKYNIELED